MGRGESRLGSRRDTAVSRAGGRAMPRSLAACARMAIAGGLADCVVVFRALAQGQVARYGQGGMAFGYGSAAPEITGEMAFPVPHGAISPAQRFAMKVRRFMEEHGVEQAALSVAASTRF